MMFFLGQHDGVFDGVLQLAYVAGPGEIAQPRQRLARDAAARAAHLLGVALDEERHQRSDVLPAVAQGREFDLEGVDPVIKVGPQDDLRAGRG